MHAARWMLGALAVLAIAYRYYSAFLAAKVLCLDDTRVTPSHRLEDGQNFHPTNRVVLFGHHFAAITGAGPLIGPVLAAQVSMAPPAQRSRDWTMPTLRWDSPRRPAMPK